MEKLLPYYETNDSICKVTTEYEEIDLGDCLTNNSLEFAIALANKYNYRVGMVTITNERGFYLIHAYAVYRGFDDVTYYVDARGQSDNFSFIEEYFSVSDIGTSGPFRDNATIDIMSPKEAYKYVTSKKYECDLTLIMPYTKLIRKFNDYYAPQQNTAETIKNKIETASLLLENDDTYGEALRNNDYIITCGYVGEDALPKEAISYYVADLLQLPIISFDHASVILGNGSFLFKVRITDDHEHVHALEHAMVCFLNDKGENCVARPYYYSDLLYVTEAHFPITDMSEYEEEMTAFLERCKQYGIVMSDSSNNYFNVTKRGKLILCDLPNCSVYDEAYYYVVNRYGENW